MKSSTKRYEMQLNEWRETQLSWRWHKLVEGMLESDNVVDNVGANILINVSQSYYWVTRRSSIAYVCSYINFKINQLGVFLNLREPLRFYEFSKFKHEANDLDLDDLFNDDESPSSTDSKLDDTFLDILL